MVNSRDQVKPLFEDVLEEYYKYIFKFTVKQVKNITDAKDLTQSIFLKAYANFKKFNPKKANVKTWLFTIANNTIISFWKSGYYRYEKTLEYDFDRVTDSADILETFIQEENAGIVLSIMDQFMSQRDVRLMSLYFFSNLTPGEIADTMKMNQKTVSNIVSLSIKKIKVKLEEHING